MMSVCVPGGPDDVSRQEALIALREGMTSTLRSASLPNRVCDAADLINWCALFTNPHRLMPTHRDCTTTMAARSATRSSTSTRSKRPKPSGLS